MHNNSPTSMHLWWYGWPASVRSPLWSALLATLTILGLLLAFHQVVSGAVQQGELRHQATALHGKAIWNCNTMGSLRANETCLSQLKALARVNPLLQAYITPGVGSSNAQVVLVTSLELLSDK